MHIFSGTITYLGTKAVDISAAHEPEGKVEVEVNEMIIYNSRERETGLTHEELHRHADSVPH